MADLENFLDCGFDVTLRKVGDRVVCKGVQSRHLAPALVIETIGETIEQALHREILEEVSMTFTTMKLIDNVTATSEFPEENAVFHRIAMIYAITGLAPVDQASEMHHSWVSLVDLPNLPATPLLAKCKAALHLL